MKIRQATIYDLVEVLFLLRDCIYDMNTRGLKQWNSANPGPNAIKQDIENGTLYIYQESGIIRGMIKLTEEMPSEYVEIKWNGPSKKVLYIKSFAIHPLWNDSDVSEQLITFAEDMAKENAYTEIRLDVIDSYPVDSKFFQDRSFTVAGTFHSEFQKLPYTCFEKVL